jgi:hypothetical protein
MAEMGSWGDKIFEVTQNRILPFKDFTTSAELKADNSVSKKKNLELEKVTLTVLCMMETGADPGAEYITWRALIGQSHFLYMNGTMWTSYPLKLKKVTLGGTKMDDFGRIHYAELNLEFEEENIENELIVLSRAMASEAEKQARILSQITALGIGG